MNAVTEEFWDMVTASISDQALHFKSNIHLCNVGIILFAC